MEIYIVQQDDDTKKLLLIPEIYKQIKNSLKRTGIIYEDPFVLYFGSTFKNDFTSYLKLNKKNSKEYTQELQELKETLILSNDKDIFLTRDEMFICLFYEEIMNKLNDLL